MREASACTSRFLGSLVTTVILLLCWHDSLVQANAPPVFTGLPTTVFVGERNTDERFLLTFLIADPNGESFTCDSTIEVIVGGGTPAASPEFRVSYDSRTKTHQLWVTDNTDFTIANTDITRFRVQVVCRDHDNTSSIVNYVDVQVVPGEVVTIDNLILDQNVNVLLYERGDFIKDVTATSYKGHSLTYNMTQSPSFAPESEFFTIDPSNGIITANRDLKYLDAGTTSMFLTVTVHDEVDFIDVVQVLTLHFTEQNHIPVLEGLETPKTASFLETFGTGDNDFLLQLTLSDPDQNQRHTYTFTSDPEQGTEIFYIDNDLKLRLIPGQTMDHEGIDFYHIEFYVDDECHTGGPFEYFVSVIDDNEPPYFDDPMLYATIYEGGKGSVTFEPGFDCMDDDVGDTFTYELCNPANDSNRFTMINSPLVDKGKMTLDVNYDIDNGAMPAEVIITVCCVDSGGLDKVLLTGTTQVTIEILDRNDNKPVFGQTSYTFKFNENTAKGSIGTLAVTDLDLLDNAIFKCSGVSSEDTSNVFAIGQDCNVYLENDVDFDFGKHTTYTAYAVDNGSPALTGTAVIDIIYCEATTTTAAPTTATSSTSDDDDGFFDSAANIAMLTMLLLMSLLLLGLLSWCLARLCCGCGTGGQGMCNCVNRGKMYPPRQVLPNSPPPQYAEKQRYRVVTVAKTAYRNTGMKGPRTWQRPPIQGTLPGTTMTNPRSFY